MSAATEIETVSATTTLGWKILMSLMVLVLLLSAILILCVVRQGKSKPQTQTQPQKRRLDEFSTNSSLVRSLLSPMMGSKIINDTDRDWPFATQYAGLHALHENLASVTSEKDR